MIPSFRRAVAGLLAVPAFAAAQAPVVPLAEPMPAIPGQSAPAAPKGMIAVPPVPTAPTPPAVAMPVTLPPATETPAEEPAEEPQRYLLDGLFAQTAVGKNLQDQGYRIYGWTAFSQNLSSARNNNFPRTLDDRANQFVMNQNYLVLEKSLDTSKKEFQLGGAAHIILPGSDARYTVIRGLHDGQLTDNAGLPRPYPIDPFQFYAEAFLPNVGPQGTSVKVGRFATHIGYELVQAVDTPFVSRSYMFQTNPFTHTGVWATTALNDTWTISNGISTGADTFIDPANRATYIGQLKWAPKDGKTSVAFNTMVTDPTFDAVEAFTFYNYYGFLATHQFTDKLSYVLDIGYSHTRNAPLANGTTGFANWYGAAQYLIYAHTDKLTSTARVELFEDAQGLRTGTAGLYTTATYGLQWKPMPWLYLRPSVRYDHNTNAPFEGNANLWAATMECIVRW